MSKNLGRRLNSWKQISQYLGRHVRTVRRWEKKGVGMPIHRVPGGRSVFAYTEDLDAWLVGQEPPEATEDEGGHRALSRPAVRLDLGLVFLVAVAAIAIPWGGRSVPEISHLETSNGHILGYDLRGRVAWTFEHPEGRMFEPADQFHEVAQVGAEGEKLFLFAGTTISGGGTPRILSELMAFGSSGQRRWNTVRTDSYRFGHETFSGPWISGALDAHPTSEGTRVAWAVHHHTWWPGALFLLDEGGGVQGPFVNSGWITVTTVVADPAGDRLLAGGVSNSQSGAMLAVLDVADIRGSSPEQPDSEFACTSCPPNGPLRYLVFPPTDVNRASGLPYNRTAAIDVGGGQIHITVREGLPSSDVAWIYHFSMDFDFLAVTPGDSYWPTHRLLELDGKLNHGEASCPWRSPPPIRSWTPDGGWTALTVSTG
ncbi:MAG: hypothetical protein BMS9Abin29_2639 [Gemmatimonadota bacterium]|nr:MAG: hypothetical protein BMS9Abin29_2639 [Gemmatimonadota bacterium]